MPPLLSFLLSPIQVAPKLRYGIAQRVAVGVFGVGFLVLFVNVRRETGQIGCFDLLGSKGLPCPVTLAHHCCIANQPWRNRMAFSTMRDCSIAIPRCIGYLEVVLFSLCSLDRGVSYCVDIGSSNA